MSDKEFGFTGQQCLEVRMVRKRCRFYVDNPEAAKKAVAKFLCSMNKAKRFDSITRKVHASMSGSIFDGCSDSCGWIAGIIAALAYGSFGVPIRETKDIDVHPLVFQSYKTTTMFFLSWFVILMGVTPSWTPWGLVSGGLWVLGGTGGILAIRYAGLAIAVGTWASVMITINFVVGILFFKEPVANKSETFAAFILLGIGLVGMSVYSAPQSAIRQDESVRTSESGYPSNQDDRGLIVKRTPSYVVTDDFQPQIVENSSYGTDCSSEIPFSVLTNDKEKDPELIVLCGFLMTKRTAGICGAVFNGVLTGSSLIPLHYAKQHGFGGANYMIRYEGDELIFDFTHSV
jgi:Transmembrane family, TMEM144 of transporters